MENKELKAIVEKQYTILIIIGFLTIFQISIALAKKIHNFNPDINVGFWMPVFTIVLIMIFVTFMNRFLEFKEVLSATFYDDYVVLKRGKRERRIPYNRIKKVVKYMIINQTYQKKWYYRVVIRCKGRNYVMCSGEDAELKLDFELTEISKIYYEFKHRGIMCC